MAENIIPFTDRMPQRDQEIRLKDIFTLIEAFAQGDQRSIEAILEQGEVPGQGAQGAPQNTHSPGAYYSMILKTIADYGIRHHRDDGLEKFVVSSAMEYLEQYRTGLPNHSIDFSEPLPARQWVIDDWLPAGRVGLLSGDGGKGKSMLATQLASAIITGDDFLTLPIRSRGRAVIVTYEDEPIEIARRLRWNASEWFDGDTFSPQGLERYKAIMSDLIVYQAYEPLWSAPDKWSRSAFTTEGYALLAGVAEFGASLLVIDCKAGAYDADENSRSEVRRFMRALDGWARENGVATIIIEHLPKSAEGKATGHSGSTDWVNASRFAWGIASGACAAHTAPKGKDSCAASPDDCVMSDVFKAVKPPNYALAPAPIEIERRGRIGSEAPSPVWQVLQRVEREMTL